MKGKMAIVGNGDSIVAFSAGGIIPYSVDNAEQAKKVISKISKDYQIIFLTDELAIELGDVIQEYLASAYPIILTIPSAQGNNGYGMTSLKKAMEKALGVDILFNDNND